MGSLYFHGGFRALFSNNADPSMWWCCRLHLREDDGPRRELDGGEDGEAGGGGPEQPVSDAAAHRLVRQALHPWYAGTVTTGNDRGVKNA
jgi:hypothetical protein